MGSGDPSLYGSAHAGRSSKLECPYCISVYAYVKFIIRGIFSEYLGGYIAHCLVSRS